MLHSTLNFGTFINIKRKEQGVTQKNIAEALGVTTVYICDIEKNRRYPPTKGDMLTKLASILKLNENEQSLLYDLAGYDKGCVSPDLSEYIMSSELVRSALRKARDKATTDDWKWFIDNLEKKQK
ncbi:MAG: helix-turn-helix transcriptional regulator [Clostridiaceae bacterium]|jgi:transcriptional regulator with XRE-family HTH domain|nr:helix-turn-helix transcriptional regulator [Clostridiaceae bacterium]